MGVPIETEAKFICTESLTEKDVSVALKTMGLAVEWHEPQKQIDTYFDTSDGVLLEAGASLRMRQIGTKIVGTFKLSKSQKGAVMERQEIEWKVGADDAQVLSGKAVDLPWVSSEVASSLQGLGIQSVAPVLTVSTVRRKADAFGLEGFRVEVALDEATFIGARGEAKQWELELELKAGEVKRLRDVATALGEWLGLKPSVKSKFAVGMEKVG